MADTLRAAAQAVVDRWDTPLWKDVPATAEYIGRLRASLAASAGSEPVAAAAQSALETLERTHQSLARQIDLIAERAPGNFLDKRPVVSTLTMHQRRTEAAAIALRTALVTHPSPPEGMAGWISVDERLPETGVTVLVYEPFRHGEDWPGTVRISFDHICPDYEGWHDHCASYEHFMAVGGVNACGSDVTCTGPSEKAPYTHWMPLPAPPLPASAKEL